MSSYNLMLYASLEASRPESGAAAFGVGAATALCAHLNVLAPHVEALMQNGWEGRTAEQIERDDAARHRKLSALVEAIAANARANGVSVSSRTEWAHAFGPISFVGDHARLHDMVIAGVDRSIFLSERKVVEHVLFEAGRPVVVVPSDHPAAFSCKRVVVAWDHTRAAARALHDSLPFLRLAEEVRLIAVGGEKRFQTNPDRKTIEDSLSRKGLNARFEQVDVGARAIGQALQDEALARGADLLVMGGFGHSRLQELVLGGATREVLEDPRLPVLMSH